MVRVQPNFLNPTFANLRPTLRGFCSSSSSKAYYVSAAVLDTQLIPPPKITKRGVAKGRVGANGRSTKDADDAQLKEKWLAPLSCPFLEPKFLNQDGEDDTSVDASSDGNLVIGIDPDLSGVLAVLKTDTSGACSAEVEPASLSSEKDHSEQ